MHLRIFGRIDGKEHTLVDRLVDRVPQTGERVVVDNAIWIVIEVTTVFDTPVGQSERYDVLAAKFLDLDT